MVTRIDKAGVVSSGSTIERTLADRFADVVNVKDFGAVGNDVADDTEAFNSAITQALASSNPILIPAGIYRVGDLDVIPNEIKQTLKIVGVGRRSSVIRHTGGGSFITLGVDEPPEGFWTDEDYTDSSNADQDWASFHFEGICVTSTDGEKGINFMWRFSGCMIRDSHFEGFSDGAIFGEGIHAIDGDEGEEEITSLSMPKSWNSHVDNCSFAHNHSAILVKDHAWCFSDCRIYGNQYGIRTISGDTEDPDGATDDGRSAMNINGCNFGPANVACIALSGQQGCSIAGCYFENNYDNGVWDEVEEEYGEQVWGGDNYDGAEYEAFQYNPDLETSTGNAPCILIEGVSNIGISVTGCLFQAQSGLNSHIEIDTDDIIGKFVGLVFIGNCFAARPVSELPDGYERYCIKITGANVDEVEGLLYTGNYISSGNVTAITNREASFSVLERREGGASTTIDNQDTTHTGKVFYRSRDADVFGDAGTFTMWMSDGTGTGDDGDVYIRSKNDAGVAAWFRFRHTPPAYTATLHTEERDLDSNSSTVAQLANVLGTLINDLQNRGIVG